MNLSLVHNNLGVWYEQHHRVLPWRETCDPYRIWLSEIILQQTRVEQGMGYYLRFVDRFPNVMSLAEASEDEVLRYWQGLGYYSRARNLHRAAKILAEQAKGERAPQNTGVFGSPAEAKGEDIYHFWRSLPGVGDYTAGAVASFAYNLPYVAIDGNVYRVLARLYDCEIPFDTTEGKKHFKKLGEALLDRNNPRLYNSAIMELGALQCTPSKPDCGSCPLQACCLAYAHGTVELLPVRKPRPKLRDRYLNYTIYCTSDMYTLIHQRTGKDIWQHLYEFVLEESEALLPTPAGCPSVDLVHVLSHQRLHARFHIKKVSELPPIPDTIVIPLSSLDEYALSRLTLRALDALGGII